MLSRTIPFSAKGFPYSEDLALDDLGEIDCDGLRLAGLEPGGGQKSVDHLGHLLRVASHDAADLSPVGHGGPLVIGDNLDIGPNHGERSAEIVAGVGEESPLAGECPVQPLEHPVKGGGKPGDLVIGAFESDAAAQIGRLDLTGHVGDLLHRSEDPARHHPSNNDAQQEQGDQGEDRGLGHLVEDDLVVDRLDHPHLACGETGEDPDLDAVLDDGPARPHVLGHGLSTKPVSEGEVNQSEEGASQAEDNGRVLNRQPKADRVPGRHH